MWEIKTTPTGTINNCPYCGQYTKPGYIHIVCPKQPKTTGQHPMEGSGSIPEAEGQSSARKDVMGSTPVAGTIPQTTILPLDDIIHRLDCFINLDNVGTIFPENFFTSIRHYLERSDEKDAELVGCRAANKSLYEKLHGDTTTTSWQPMEKYCGYRSCVFYYPATKSSVHRSNDRDETFSTDGPWPNRLPSHFMELRKP